MRIMPQSGRSMIEMIGSLVIMGVLSVVTGLGLKYLFDKNTANQIMKDAHLGYISIPVSSCVNDFIPVEFTPDSGYQTDFYCDRKKERYVRVSGISDVVCEHLLGMQSDNGVELYNYDEYTVPLCNKGENALIFAFADTGFPAIPCESINDCPPDFYGICHETDKMCLKCSEGQMPNTARNQCVDLQCNDETETLCDNGRAKWCCPNTEICGMMAGECIKSDGMCSYVFLEPKVTKTYDCAYKFNEPVVEQEYDCAYKMVSDTHEDGFETVDFVEVKPCANSSLYCNLRYADTSCGTTAAADIAVGEIIYGSCSEMGRGNTQCTVTVDDAHVLEAVKPCANSSLYCNLKYVDETCETTAPAETGSGQIIYGSCSEMGRADVQCAVSVDDTHVLQEIKTCPAKQYCHLKYVDEQCTAAGAEAQDLLFGVCLDMNSGNAICPIPNN